MSAIFDLVAKLTLDKSEYDQGLDEAQEDAGGFGESLVKAGKIGAAAVAAIGTAVVGSGAALVKATGNVAEYGDNIDKMSQKMGMSAEAYQEWDAVMQHSGTSMEAMKASMKTLANAAETGSDAFEKLGISQEELSNLSQEQLFERTISALQNVEDETQRTYLAGKTLGRGATELGALLNTSAEDTQAMRDRVRELGGVMSDDAVKAAAAYQDSLQDMNTAISSVKRGLLSEFLPSVTQAMDGITEIFGGDGDKGGQLLSEGISGLLASIEENAPKFGEKVMTIVEAIGTAITDNAPSIMEKGAELVTNLISGVVESAPEVLASGLEMISTLASGIASGIPTLVSKAASMITEFTGGLSANIGTIIDSGIEIITSLVEGIMGALPTLIASLPQIVTDIAGAIIENAPKLLTAGMELLGTVGSGLVEAIPQLIEKIPEIVSAIKEKWQSVDWAELGKKVITFIGRGVRSLMSSIPTILKSIGTTAVNIFKNIDWISAGTKAITTIVSAISSLFSDIPSKLGEIGSEAMSAFKDIDWWSVGSNVIDGIANGISSGVERIKSAAKNAAEKALNAAKSFLGIESPSKVFRDQVGDMIAKGWAIGIEDSGNLIDRAIESISNRATKGIDLNVSPLDIGMQVIPAKGTEAGGKTVNNIFNIRVDGAESPEDFASRLVAQLELDLRTA